MSAELFIALAISCLCIARWAYWVGYRNGYDAGVTAANKIAAAALDQVRRGSAS